VLERPIRPLDRILPQELYAASKMQTEINIDGMVGPTHHFGGLGVGNVASQAHSGQVSNPRDAAIQGLEKMCRLAGMGVPQFFLPPSPRPNLYFLSQLGFQGSPSDQLKRAYDESPEILSAAYSSAFMWTANAATVSSGADCADGMTHITVANLCSNLHRSQEASERLAMLRELFASVPQVRLHGPLPSSTPLRDEGAANHMRLWDSSSGSGISVFAYSEDYQQGRRQRFPSRHSKAASLAIARQHGLIPDNTFMLRQHPEAIDAGVFHNDVIATSNMNLFIHHELAFVGAETQLQELDNSFQRVTGRPLIRLVVPNSRLPLEQAVASYLFNSQIIVPTTSHSKRETPEMVILCPRQCQEINSARGIVEDWVRDPNIPIQKVEYVALDQSMAGGGGPACLRLRVCLDEHQIREIPRAFWLTPERLDALRSWVIKYYPAELSATDLAREEFAQHALSAVDALYREMNLSIRTTDLMRFKSV
jgi:succinylarginine dihydrolase